MVCLVLWEKMVAKVQLAVMEQTVKWGLTVMLDLQGHLDFQDHVGLPE